VKPKLVFLGLSITSAWGNGHATTYRSLLRGLSRLGYDLLFLERDVPWYAENRDCAAFDGCRIELYQSLLQLQTRFESEISRADAVIVGSYVPEGIAVLRWVLEAARGLRLFYDIDTPVTLTHLAEGTPTYVDRSLIGELDGYLSFSGGPALDLIEREYGARVALPLYCSVDPSVYRSLVAPRRHALTYLGTYSADRQPVLEALLFGAARALPHESFAIGGSGFPGSNWPENVQRLDHVNPGAHGEFYNHSRFTLNVTRQDMKRLGHSPSVRLFEAAACGTPIISDPWPGLDTFFVPDREILIANDTEDVLRYLRDVSENERRAIGARARARILREHTAEQRARLLGYYLENLRAARTEARVRNVSRNTANDRFPARQDPWPTQS